MYLEDVLGIYRSHDLEIRFLCELLISLTSVCKNPFCSLIMEIPPLIDASPSCLFDRISSFDIALHILVYSDR